MSSNAATFPRVEAEAECAALAAWSDFDHAAAEWAAGATPGMTAQAAAARAAMTDPDAEDVDAAHADYHAACLGQAADIARDRHAASARIAQMMHALRSDVDEAEDDNADRIEAVDAAIREHAGLSHVALIPVRTTSERAAAGWQTGS